MNKEFYSPHEDDPREFNSIESEDCFQFQLEDYLVREIKATGFNADNLTGNVLEAIKIINHHQGDMDLVILDIAATLEVNPSDVALDPTIQTYIDVAIQYLTGNLDSE